MKKICYAAGIISLVALVIFFSTGGVETVKEFLNIFDASPSDSVSAFTFAGEKIPTNGIDVKERLDREINLMAYDHAQIILYYKRVGRWFPTIEKILKEEGIPDDFKYMPIIESAFLNTESPQGAAGYWQLISSTGKKYGLIVNNYVDQRYDVELATRAACKYLKDAHDKFGMWTLAAAAYNMGVDGILRAQKNQRVRSYYDLFLNIETSRFIFRIVAVKEILENLEKYGYHLTNENQYKPFIYKTITIDSSIIDLPLFAIHQGVSYKNLKILNPWLRNTKLLNPDKMKFTLKLPLQKDAHLFTDDNEIPARMSGGDSLLVKPMENLIEKIHIVKEGETIDSVANIYGVTIEQILEWNEMKSKNIRKGDKLKILAEEEKNK